MAGHTLVVGAGGGIGRAVARQQGGLGHPLSLVDVSADALETAREVAADAGASSVESLSDDPSSERGAARLASWVQEHGRGLDGLVYAAGVTGPVAPVDSYPGAAFEEVVRVNLTGAFHVLANLLPLMREEASASIVVLGSTSSIRGRRGLSGYVASKHGVLGLVRAAAVDLAGSTVRINAVLPGPVDTPMLDQLDSAAATAGTDLARGPGAAPATPQQVADVIGFLLSDQSRHMHGAGLVVDGGGTVA